MLDARMTRYSRAGTKMQLRFLTIALAIGLTAGVVTSESNAQARTDPPAKQQRKDLLTETPPGKPPQQGAEAPKERKKKIASPLDLLMKDGIPAHAEKRAVLREDLYALLATAANKKEAKRISAQIERVWRTSGSDTVSVLMLRATRALKAKDQKLALTLLDSVVELAPENAEAWNRRAFIHYSSKDFRAAVGDLRRALALDKSHFKALDGLASIFQQIGEDAKALQVYKQLRDIHPFWPGLDKTVEKLEGKVQGRGI